MSVPKHILWWGRFNPAYSRNGVLRGHLAALGCRVSDFCPRLCAFGDLEAALRGLPRPDAVWVPCFRQRDLAAARRWCDRRRVPLVFDPLISAYDKQVFERAKLKAGSAGARHLLAWERGLFARADLVLADTACHADYFAQTLGVPRGRVRVVYVGADETLFSPAPERAPGAPPDVLFYGSFIPLHGVRTIIDAARLYRGPPVRWSLLGAGPARADGLTAAAGLDTVFFEDAVPYAQLPSRIHRADILLGVFGATQKAGRVIPNKVFQSLAAGRPVITRESPAYPGAARRTDALAFVPPGDPAALASAVAAWASEPARLAARNRAARAVYDACFAAPVVRGQLAAALSGL
ncbi:MAG: glycosyltransferase [Verrucomicrobiota bacterium]|jgi:glycosyltransferase involved in cell wall biosynthesis|nr:glycosyltransferase [Verrucomicrobiota bacterium]